MYTILYVIKRQLIIAITMISLFSYILLFFIDNELHERRRYISIIICPRTKRIKKNQLIFLFRVMSNLIYLFNKQEKGLRH